MLEDFIEANSTKAEILRKRLLLNQAKCFLLVSRKEGEMPVLAVVPAGTRVSLEKAEKESGVPKLMPADESETQRITGYEYGFLPPVSIYGVKVLVEKSLLEKEYACVLVGEDVTLRIESEAILELNEDSKKCGILEK